MRSASFPAKRFILHQVMPLDTTLFRSGSSPATAARLVRSRDDRPPQGMARWGRLLVLVAGLAATGAAAFGEQSPSGAAVLPSLGRLPAGLRAAALLSFPKLTPEYEAELGDAFFDQSHMIREINRFVGRTPARLKDAANPYLSEMIAPKNLRELGS